MILIEDFEQVLGVHRALREELDLRRQHQNGSIIAKLMSIDGHSAICYHTANEKRFVWIYIPKPDYMLAVLFGTDRDIKALQDDPIPVVKKCNMLRRVRPVEAVKYVFMHLFGEDMPQQQLKQG